MMPLFSRIQNVMQNQIRFSVLPFLFGFHCDQRSYFTQVTFIRCFKRFGQLHLTLPVQQRTNSYPSEFCRKHPCKCELRFFKTKNNFVYVQILTTHKCKNRQHLGQKNQKIAKIKIIKLIFWFLFMKNINFQRITLIYLS